MKELSIYIHIPFCKSKCNYCSFYSIPTSELKSKQYAGLLTKEIKITSEKYSLEGSHINSMYFGGGTPSIMPISFFSNLMNYIQKNFKINENAEITAEINPESGDFKKLSDLKLLGINRLSIGAQSFNDTVLKTAGRIHNKKDTYNAVSNAKKAGFENISLDLIIGLPGQTKNILLSDIEQILDICPKHISAYMLSIEKGTQFYKIYNRKNDAGFITDEKIAEYYEALCAILCKSGYGRYEISNFAKAGYESRHNINYWNRDEYLGLGPSASSFLKLAGGMEIRKTNISDLYKYADNIMSNSKSISHAGIPDPYEYTGNIVEKFGKSGNVYNSNNNETAASETKTESETDFIEILSEKDKINEEIFLSLRTASGINAKRLNEFVSPDVINGFIREGLMELCDMTDMTINKYSANRNRFVELAPKNIALTVKGVLLSSEIFARIMI